MDEDGVILVDNRESVCFLSSLALPSIVEKVYAGHEDPGVLSVRRIYGYFKKFGYRTIVMG
jgi:hypothetical protein